TRSPSRPSAGRAADAGVSARASACASRGLRPSRLLRGRWALVYGWGARIRTWDRGTKTRCLTTWLRPNESLVFEDGPAGKAGVASMGGAASRRLGTWLRPTERRVVEDGPAGKAGVASMVGAASRRLGTWLRPTERRVVEDGPAGKAGVASMGGAASQRPGTWVAATARRD